MHSNGYPTMSLPNLSLKLRKSYPRHQLCVFSAISLRLRSTVSSLVVFLTSLPFGFPSVSIHTLLSLNLPSSAFSIHHQSPLCIPLSLRGTPHIHPQQISIVCQSIATPPLLQPLQPPHKLRSPLILTTFLQRTTNQPNKERNMAIKHGIILKRFGCGGTEC